MIVPDTVTGPTNAPLLDPDIDNDVNVWAFFTKKSVDNVLASTKENLNEWITVKANVKEDFKKFHNLDVDQLDGLAIMADTDNSKLKSVSYFQNIYFSSK